MKKLLIALMVVASTMAMVATEAQAKRMGGGGSIGRQSQSAKQAPAQAAKPAAPAATPGAVPPKPASAWKGMLGGALLGLGLGAMLSHFGMGGALGGMLGSILMIALLGVAAMFIYRMFRKKTDDSAAQPAYAGAYPSGNSTPEIGSRIEPAGAPSAFQGADAAAGGAVGVAGAAGAAAAAWTIPADFDVPGFLRNSKTYFIRLQAAWDKADINDLREFTSSEMYGELKLQIQERGASANVTDVVTLDAELLGVETIGNDYHASVKFSGMIKESASAPAEAFAEIWNMSKPMSGQGGWVLAGIQQLN